MTGYKLYFDGEKFVAENTKSEVDIKSSNQVTNWFKDYQSAACMANKYNNDKASNYVKKCKDCGEYFWLFEDEIQWFYHHGMEMPRRCRKCRDAKK